jgi:hypothetical protein
MSTGNGNGQVPKDLLDNVIRPDAHVIARNVITSKLIKRANAPTQEELAKAITQITLNGSTKDISNLVVSLQDPDWKFLDSGFFDTDENGLIDPIDLNYPDGSRFWWRLTQISPKADQSVQLTFLTREVVYLMHLLGPIKGDRAKMTRAEFLKMLTTKAQGRSSIEFYSLELHIKEPIAAAHASSGSGGGASTGQGPAKKWAVKVSLEASSSGTGWTELSSNGYGAAAAGHAKNPNCGPSASGCDFATLGKAYSNGTMLSVQKASGGPVVTRPKTDSGNGSSFGPAIGITPDMASALGGIASEEVVHIWLPDGSDMTVVSGFGTRVA